MEPENRFACHIEAQPGERPEFCSGGICCGVYKRQSILSVLILWTLLLVFLVLPVLYCTLVWVTQSRSGNLESDVDHQSDHSRRSREDVPLSRNKRQANEPKHNRKDSLEIYTESEERFNERKDQEKLSKQAKLPTSKKKSSERNSFKEDNSFKNEKIPENQEKQGFKNDNGRKKSKKDKYNSEDHSDQDMDPENTKRTQADLAPLTERSANNQGKENINEDYPLNNKRKSKEQLANNKEKINDNTKKYEPLDETEERKYLSNGNVDFPSSKKQPSDKKTSACSKEDEVLERQEIFENSENKNKIAKGNNIKDKKFQSKEMSTNTDIVSKSSKLTQANLNLHGEDSQNSEKEHSEIAYPSRKDTLREKNSSENKFSTQENNPPKEKSESQHEEKRDDRVVKTNRKKEIVSLGNHDDTDQNNPRSSIKKPVKISDDGSDHSEILSNNNKATFLTDRGLNHNEDSEQESPIENKTMTDNHNYVERQKVKRDSSRGSDDEKKKVSLKEKLSLRKYSSDSKGPLKSLSKSDKKKPP